MSRADTAVATVDPRLILQHECVDSRWKYVYDGCSVPAMAAGIATVQRGAFDKDNPAGGRDTQFARGLPTTEGGVACDRHDECYQSCVTERDACDSRMYAGMKQICAQSKESAGVKATCYEWATLYYTALKRGAEGAFQQRKRQVCGCDKGLVPAAMSRPPLSLLTHRSGARKGQHLTWLEYTIMSTLPPLSAYQSFANSAQYEEYVRYVRPADPSRGETR
ncbi:hypothetical protein ABZV14_27960 [Streptosporangium canum]|uniref:hypothetical protein n=1 Tax=Streptosporangium canum TaxID=324952 RepID=UPI0033A28389